MKRELITQAGALAFVGLTLVIIGASLIDSGVGVLATPLGFVLIFFGASFVLGAGFDWARAWHDDD